MKCQKNRVCPKQPGNTPPHPAGTKFCKGCDKPGKDRVIKKKIRAAIVQADGIKGWAAYLSPTVRRRKVIIGLNVEALVIGVAAKDFTVKELPYIVADSIMHEVIHALEDWARVQFSEKKVEKLIEAYRRHYRAQVGSRKRN